jgi:tetratricopeptide (TPR) repeat protein
MNKRKKMNQGQEEDDDEKRDDIKKLKHDNHHYLEITKSIEKLEKLGSYYKELIVEKIQNIPTELYIHLYNLLVENKNEHDHVGDGLNDLLVFFYGIYHQYITKDYKKMVYYYEKAIEFKDTYAMIQMAYYHGFITNDHDKMKEFYFMAIKLNCSIAMFCLGCYFEERKEYEQMEQNFQMAVKLNHKPSINKLALYHQDITHDFQKAELYFEMGVQLNCLKAMFNFAYYHQYTSHNYEQMKIHYQKAIQLFNDSDAMYQMAEYHRDIDINYVKMEEYFKMAIHCHDVDAMMALGSHHHQTSHDFQQMTQYYKMAIELKNQKALQNFCNYILKNQVYEHIPYILDRFQTLFNNVEVNLAVKKQINSLKEIQNHHIPLESMNLDSFACVACTSAVRNIIFLPCHHASMCMICSKKMVQNKCPICQAHIQKKQTIIWS